MELQIPPPDDFLECAQDVPLDFIDPNPHFHSLELPVIRVEQESGRR